MTPIPRIGVAIAAAAVLSVAISTAGGAGVEESSNGPDAEAAPPGPAAPLPQGAPVSPSNGTLYFSIDANDDDEEGALYSLDVNTAEATEIGPTGVDSSTVGLSEGPDPNVLIGSTWTDITFINIDGSGFESEDNDLMEAEGLAFDPTTNTLYKGLNDNEFATASLTTGETIDALALMPDDAEAEGLAWRGTDGRIYGFGEGDDTLYAYTPATDTWEAVGDTGIVPSEDAGLAWDPIADVLYAIVLQGDTNESNGGGSAFLYRIDPDDASSSFVGNTGLPGGGGLAFLVSPQPPPPPPEPPEPGPVVVEPTFTG